MLMSGRLGRPRSKLGEFVTLLCLIFVKVVDDAAIALVEGVCNPELTKIEIVESDSVIHCTNYVHAAGVKLICSYIPFQLQETLVDLWSISRNVILLTMYKVFHDKLDINLTVQQWRASWDSLMH